MHVAAPDPASRAPVTRSVFRRQPTTRRWATSEPPSHSSIAADHFWGLHVFVREGGLLLGSRVTRGEPIRCPSSSGRRPLERETTFAPRRCIRVDRVSKRPRCTNCATLLLPFGTRRPIRHCRRDQLGQ